MKLKQCFQRKTVSPQGRNSLHRKVTLKIRARSSESYQLFIGKNQHGQGRRCQKDPHQNQNPPPHLLYLYDRLVTIIFLIFQTDGSSRAYTIKTFSQRHFLLLYSPVCVRPGRKPRRHNFSRCVSYNFFSK